MTTPSQQNSGSVSRRQFIKSAAAGSVILAAPSLAIGKKTDQKTIVGSGEYRYEIHHQHFELPAEFHWQTTHNAAVDSEGLVYVIHEGKAELKDHPAIFVFSPEGKLVRSFGSQFQGGGHGLEVHQEGREEFLYVTGYKHLKTFAKLTLKGETVWQKYAPMQAGVYADGEAKNPQNSWGRDRFLPTNFAFLPDGDFLLADGYGSFYMHRYSADGEWKSCFGGPGKGEGTFSTPHGIWVDNRSKTPRIVVADRAHHTLQFFDLEGNYQETVTGFGLPANLDTYKDILLVPELVARVSLLGPDNQVVAQLGSDVDRISADSKKAIRRNEKQWLAGKFVHPHDACFDLNGNIIVPEWVSTGRVSFLKKIT